MPKSGRQRPVRKCSVGNCQSVELDKIMFSVPIDGPRRINWEKAVGCALRSNRDCVCEDHFLLEEDAENWIRYKLMPGTKLLLKKTAVPHRFNHNSSQSQFAGYSERFLGQSQSTSSQKKNASTKLSKNELGNAQFPQFLGASYINTTFDGRRFVPCSCMAVPRQQHGFSTTTVTDGHECLEPEVTIKEEPEEYTEGYDFPLVIVKEEPFWEGMASEDTQLESGIVYDPATQNGNTCLPNTNNYGCVEVHSSEESSRLFPSSPSSPSSPVDDSDEDPEYNVDLEKRLEESTDDEKLEYEPRKLIPEGWDRIYICYWCNRKFKLRRWMKIHLYKKHSGEKPYACNKCDFRAIRRCVLRDHKYSHHSAKRRFICDVCKQRYATKPALQNHMKNTHTSEKRFTCDHCDFKTNYKEKIKMHTMRHTGEKPRACKFCEARFIQPGALKTHMLIHTGEKPYACDRCDYRCRQSGMLTNHKKVHHPDESEDDS